MTTCKASFILGTMFVLEPVLGTFTLDPQNLKAAKIGGHNSTRWIISIEQPRGPVPPLSFWLVRGRIVQDPAMLSFSFAPHTHNFYDARPTLSFVPGGSIALRALAVNEGAAYQLSIDVMHSMFR